MGIVRTIDFHGDQLLGFEDDRGIYIALRPMVLGMGLDWSAQLKRIKRDPLLAGAVAMMATTGSPAGDKEGVCLPIDLVPGFLFKIDASRVDEAVRPKVLEYQRSAFMVLARAFLRPDRAADIIEMPTEAVPLDIARKLVTEARHTFDHQSARELWFRLQLPIVPAMRAGPAQGSLFTYREG